MKILYANLDKMNRDKLKKKAGKLPQTPGVYFFLGKNKEVLYIGKATSIRNRVRSYFSKDIAEKRSPLIARMVEESISIDHKITDSVLEALIIEADLIKKFLPTYNIVDKDQKSWNFVIITDEDFPRILIERERTLKADPGRYNIKYKFGPFTHGNELKEALKIVRRIFPFRDKCNLGQDRPCFNYQIGLCPGTCVGKISKQEYAKTIKHIKLFFEGKKKDLIKTLEQEMKEEISKQNFEIASSINKKISALKHINDMALLKRDIEDAREKGKTYRIEAYDIAHQSGQNIVGVMTVLENGLPNKNEYRMFKINGQIQADDTKALKEVLTRRFTHPEWQVPNLIVVDGSTAQINVAKSILEEIDKKIEWEGEKEYNLDNERIDNKKIDLVAVTKDERHKAREIKGKESVKNYDQKLEKSILLANSEAHRFSIKYHRKVRGRAFL